ncbi:cytochrome P450 7B1 [Thalassophryne amazonica]|uniref:cytochrome P450 7B1 n=1 Tax=Thalassophryne amazonica TaxID=390379 RepID=UPI0014717BDE|nr:cytochrome P450 7B1 [Thalassophryne amazonica]
MSLLLLLLLGLLSALLLLLRSRRRRDGEPPLITGWIPFLGKVVEFRKDAHKFLEEQKSEFGDVFTVLIAGRYMTFIMNPLLYPSIIKHGRQLDFHEFSGKVAPFTFGYPPVLSSRFPGLQEHIIRSFQLLQAENLTPLTDSMMGNLMLVFRQDHLTEGPTAELEEGGWRTSSIYQFCNSVMFEATFLTLYGKPASGGRHSGTAELIQDFVEFDSKFSLLIAQIPIWLLGQTKAIRQRLINYFLPHRMSRWTNTSQFIRWRAEVFEQYEALTEVDKAAHHFAILWASVGNTIPAAFWVVYYLVSHPEALDVVHQEIRDVLKLSSIDFSSDRDIRLGREQLDQLQYLESAINESLRLSSGSMNIRVAQEDFRLRLDSSRSVDVRKGDIIALYPQTVHMDPEIYEDPQMFRFDRFMQDGKDKTDFYKDGQRLRYYLMPFGSGASMCPGRHFAINEMKQFLCLLLLYFQLQLEDGQTPAGLDHSRAGLGILLPSHDVRFRYRRRDVTSQQE